MKSNGHRVLTVDEVLEGLPFSGFHILMVLMCGLAFMADAMEVSLLSFLSTCAGVEWNLSPAEKATITSVVFGGQIIGSLFWGAIADHYGRKRAYMIACSLISIGGFLSGAAPSFPWLLVFRCIVGFGVGGVTVAFDLLAEFLPPSHRGKYLNFIEFFWTFGSLIVSGVAWALLSDKGWRVLTYITAAPVTIAFSISLFYLPESPRWLLVKGRVSEAEQILRNAAKSCNVEIGDFSIKADGYHDAVPAEASALDLVRSPQIRRITLPLFVVWFAFGFAYYGIILFVSRIYSSNNDDGNGDDDNSSSSTCDFDYQSIFINSCAEFAGVTLAMLIIDPFGRVRTQAGLYLLCGITALTLGLGVPHTAVVALAWVGRMLAMGSSCATWVATPELLTTEMRATGHSICNTFARFGAFFSPYFVISNVSFVGVAFGLAACNVLASTASMALPETQGKHLDVVVRESVDLKGHPALSHLLDDDEVT